VHTHRDSPDEECPVSIAFTPTENRQYLGEFCVFVADAASARHFGAKAVIDRS